MFSYYGNTGCRVFKWEIQNWKDFCLKINILKRKLLKFENWCNGECQKVPKFDFKVKFLCQKLSESFSIFFFIEEYQFRSTFVIDIF